MKKFENVYQDAALMRKVLLGEADEVEQKDLEKRLAECPDLRNVYEQLQSGETLKVAFGEYQKYSSKKAYQSFLQSIGQMESKGRKSRSRRVGWYAAAAVVTLAVALSFYMSNYISSEKEGKTLIQPGTQQASQYSARPPGPTPMACAYSHIKKGFSPSFFFSRRSPTSRTWSICGYISEITSYARRLVRITPS